MRNGTTILFAVLKVARGKVNGECYSHHRHREVLKFLRKVDGEYEGGEEMHLVMEAPGRGQSGLHQPQKSERWRKCIVIYVTKH